VAQREFETYLEAEVRGKTISFLLHSECCTNILPTRMVDSDEIGRNPSRLLPLASSLVSYRLTTSGTVVQAADVVSRVKAAVKWSAAWSLAS